MLELAEEAFDKIALSVEAPVNGAMEQPLAGRGDIIMNPGSACADQFEQGIGNHSPGQQRQATT
jgi:hypothetical protein